MILHMPWVLAFCVSTLLLALGATSGLINSRLWMSEPLACALLGVLLGPLALGLVHLDPAHDPVARAVLREAARVTLAIAVLAAAIRLPKGFLWRHWRGLAVALGPGMLLMWAAGAAVTAWSFDLPLLTSILIGAIIAPTDPVLSAPVVGGELAHESVPETLRHAITAESGINDGLAQPLVMLPIVFILAGRASPTHSTDVWHNLGHWALHVIVWEVGSAIVLGAAAGYLARLCMHWAHRQPGVERSSILTIALALALAVLAGLQMIGSNGVLGAFVAGATLNEAYDDEYGEHQEHFNEAITRFFDLPIMVLLGAAAPWAVWWAMGWHAVLFVVAILLLRRLPAWALLRGGMSWTKRWPEALFAGWFGPVGAAALFYALEAQDMTGLSMLWPIVSLAAAASVLAHGVSGTHFAVFLGNRISRRAVARG